MIKRILMTLGVASIAFSSTTGCATTVHAFKENENVELNVSRDNFTRLMVENDKISQVRYPEGYLSVDNDLDGSVYLDVKDDRPFTLFITTLKNRHLSATIKAGDALGQTIQFSPLETKVLPKSAITQKKVAQKSYEHELTALLNAVEKEGAYRGYASKKAGNSPKITQSPNRHQQRGLRPLEPF